MKWDDYLEQNKDEDNYNGLNDLTREDSEFLISILAGMNFTPPYKEYITKTLKRIVNERINLNNNIFSKANISQRNIIDDFKQKLKDIDLHIKENNKSMENTEVKQYMNKILNKIGEKSNDVNNDKENDKSNNNNNEDIKKINNIEESNIIDEK